MTITYGKINGKTVEIRFLNTKIYVPHIPCNLDYYTVNLPDDVVPEFISTVMNNGTDDWQYVGKLPEAMFRQVMLWDDELEIPTYIWFYKGDECVAAYVYKDVMVHTGYKTKTEHCRTIITEYVKFYETSKDYVILH